MADAVGGNLQHVFEQRDSPADYGSDGTTIRVSAKFFRRPYQANVMKTFDAINSRVVLAENYSTDRSPLLTRQQTARAIDRTSCGDILSSKECANQLPGGAGWAPLCGAVFFNRPQSQLLLRTQRCMQNRTGLTSGDESRRTVAQCEVVPLRWRLPKAAQPLVVIF